jgi:hypothetical protein
MASSDPAQAAVLLFQRARGYDHVAGRDLVVGDVSVSEPGISQDGVVVGVLQVPVHDGRDRGDAGLARVPDKVVDRRGQAADGLVAGEPAQRRVAVRGWYRPRAAEIPQASVVQRRDRIVRPWMFPMTIEERAEHGLGLGPFRHPHQALMCTAERPQQGQRLVERQAAIRRSVPSQCRELVDQLPDGQAGYRLRHLEAETAQQASDGRCPAAEVGGGKRFLAGKEAVRDTHDRLRIVGLAVNYQAVRAGRAELVLIEERVLTQLVILRYGLEDLAAGQFLQCHIDMVGTGLGNMLPSMDMALLFRPCVSSALTREALLFKGNDFGHTDIAPALPTAAD